MRRPAETMSQRALAYELKRAIDQAMSPRPVKARHGRQRVDRLATENPIGVASSHVQHNLGNARREWFATRARARRHVDTTDARSFDTPRSRYTFSHTERLHGGPNGQEERHPADRAAEAEPA